MNPETTASPSAIYPNLRDKRIFITGGGSGIGAVLVSAFARQGSRVAFVDVAAEPSAALCAKLSSEGLAVPWWRECDVANVSALQAAIRNAAAEVGDFGVLVNNVGNDDRHELEHLSVEYYDRCIAVNQRAAVFAIQSVVPGMRRLGGGSIINIGSTGWQNKIGVYPAYAAAKSAINGLTRGLARELGADRIRINTVSPGWVITPRQADRWLHRAGEPDAHAHQCIPERIEAEDIAGMVLFLAADDARMCTAQEFVVDAGWI